MKTYSSTSLRIALLASFLILDSSFPLLAQGPLTPPGAPAPTMKSLDQVEPRIPINATNTPGDADSLFKITQPGSYYLTGNLTGVAAKYGIEVAASNVTIDLMGHSLLGAGGSLSGIATPSTSYNNLTVRNGVITGWGGNGIQLSGSGSLVEKIHASDNTIGIFVTHQAIVRSVTASRNTSLGIGTGGDALVESCVCFQNGTGITTGFRSIVTGCSVTFNNIGSGISVGGGSTVTACTVVANTSDGIRVTAGCVVTDNNCNGNGNAAGDGAGIHATSIKNRIVDNNCVGADRGIDVDLAGNIIFRNTCSDNTTNWSIAADNVFGPIVDRTAPSSALVIGDSAPDSSSNLNPNANFTY